MGILIMRFVPMMILLPAAIAMGGIFSGGAIAACLLGLVDAPAPVQLASADRMRAQFAKLAKGRSRVTYLGHSSFLIETPEGASAVTDYNGVHTPPFRPGIVTMNNAHETHFTDSPDPAIPHILRGWRPQGGIARHDVRLRDLRVFNVPTNIGEYGDPASNGNSIFVYEISDLCIAHLGHLHHVLDKKQLRSLGRIDVLFVPVDGGLTMSHVEVLAVIEQISPRLVIPMNFGFMGAADQFFELARKLYPIRSEKGSVLEISRSTLPRRTEIRFLQGGGL